jgi:hypothetical protein
MASDICKKAKGEAYFSSYSAADAMAHAVGSLKYGILLICYALAAVAGYAYWNSVSDMPLLTSADFTLTVMFCGPAAILIVCGILYPPEPGTSA